MLQESAVPDRMTFDRSGEVGVRTTCYAELEPGQREASYCILRSTCFISWTTFHDKRNEDEVY